MANEVDYSPCKYTGNGSTTEFSFNWKIFNATDVIVTKEVISTGVQTTLTYGTDYSVSFGEVAGHITLSSAPTSEYYIIISRDVSDHQSKTYSTSTGFQGSEIENSFDKVSCNLQELEYTLERAIKTQVGSPNLDMTLPVPAKGKTLKWNEAETGLENSTIDVDELESIANRLHASIDNIDTVADDITNVNTVAAISDDVIVVSNSASNVNAVGESISNVNSVAADLTNIDTVSGDLTNIDTVAGSISNVDAVGGSISNVNTVSGDLTNIDTIAGSISNVNAVGGSISNVNSVAADLTNIDAVAADLTNIDAVASDLTNIDAVAADLTNIDAASSNATLAKQYAVGLPSEPAEGSAKYWAEQAATGQVQADWNQSDNTKKDYIKNKPTIPDALPSQTGQSGKFLTTDGTNPSWSDVDSLPSQTGQSGKFLTTDGTDASWAEVESFSRNIGEIVTSTIPLTDAGLHLLDGALLQYGSYSAFIDYVADLYDSGDYTDIFETEANWQQAVTNYGVCGKFVYDSVNSTVRLPKYGNQLVTDATMSSTAPVKGNGLVLGLTNGSTNCGLNSYGNYAFCGNTNSYGANVASSGQNNNINSGLYGVTTDGTKSGIIADLSGVSLNTSDVYYYICIATTTKTQVEVDIDEIATDLNGKVDKANLVDISEAAETITGWNEIDYTAGVSITTSQIVNNNYDMLLIFYKTTNNGASAYCNVYYGTSSSDPRIVLGGTTNAAGYFCFTLPLFKNTDYYIELGGTYSSCTIYPKKGVE